MWKKFIIMIFVAIFLICGCKVKDNNGGNNNKNEFTGDTSEEDGIGSLREEISQMTLDEKVGQLVMVGLEGQQEDKLSREMIQKYKVGGFILFQRNIKDTDQTIDLINSLKDINRENMFPLFFAVDEEGGRVTRMPQEYTKLPTSRAIGSINREDLSFRLGSILGEQLKSLGLNMNFAPVLDIDSNPNNPVIGDRSFGPDEKIVSELGIQTMKGLQSQVISVVKHFPGHGDTSVDSHIGLPVVYHDLDRLEDFEFIPFKRAIEKGADGVMVAHMLLPEIDEDNPATLSTKIITDILRDEMGFDGVVITDDMTMGAIATNYDIGDAAVKSVIAGADIILVCHDYEKQVEVIEALKSAVDSGLISENELDEHLYRILNLKQKYLLDNDKIKSPDVEAINSKIGDLLDKYFR